MFYNRHIIKKQTLEFQAPDQQGARELQELVSHVYKTKVAPLLNKVCERYDQEDVVIQIENLEIDLGVLEEESITEELPLKIEALFEEELNKRIFYLGKEGFNSNTADKRLLVTKSELNSFLYFLQFGTFKWDGNPSGKKFNTLFDELYRSSKNELKQGLFSALNQQNARKRLIYHLDQKQLKSAFSLLVSQKEYTESVRLIEELKKIHRVRCFSNKSNIAFNLAIWEVALHAALEGKYAGKIQHAIFDNLLSQIRQVNGNVQDYQQKTEAELAKSINRFHELGGRINSDVLQKIAKSADSLSKKSGGNNIGNNTPTDQTDVYEESESPVSDQMKTSTVEIESKSLEEEGYQAGANESEGNNYPVEEILSTSKKTDNITNEKSKEDSLNHSIGSKESGKGSDNKWKGQQDRVIDQQKKNQSNQKTDLALSTEYDQLKNEQAQANADELKNSDRSKDSNSVADQDDIDVDSITKHTKPVKQDFQSKEVVVNQTNESPDHISNSASTDVNDSQTIKPGDEKSDVLLDEANSELLESKDRKESVDVEQIVNDDEEDSKQSQIASKKNDPAANKSLVKSKSENSDGSAGETQRIFEKRSDNFQQNQTKKQVREAPKFSQGSDSKFESQENDTQSEKDGKNSSDFAKPQEKIQAVSKEIVLGENSDKPITQRGKADNQSTTASDQIIKTPIASDNQVNENNNQSDPIGSEKADEDNTEHGELKKLDAGTSVKPIEGEDSESEKIIEAMALQKTLRVERTRERNGTQEQSNVFQSVVAKGDQLNPIPWNAPTKPLEEAWINNAGLVLIWPFLPTLFKGLEWMEDNEFKSEEMQHKAVWFLQFLVTGAVDADESELVLNKLLAGLKAETPVPAEIHISDDELKEGEHLLQVVIQNWPVLKGTSVDGFRATFLRKEGLMKKDFTGWKLHVERSTMDVLLEKLPWSYSVIKLPWVTEMIFVEW